MKTQRGKIRRRIIGHLLTTALICVCGSISGCRDGGDRGHRVRLTIAGTPATLVYVPHLVAVSLGLYKKRGLDIVVESVPGGTKAVQALIGGSADVILGYFDHPFECQRKVVIFALS